MDKKQLIDFLNENLKETRQQLLEAEIQRVLKHKNFVEEKAPEYKNKISRMETALNYLRANLNTHKKLYEALNTKWRKNHWGIVKSHELYTYPIVRMKNFLKENNKYIRLSKEQLTNETNVEFLLEYTKRISRFADKLLKYNIDDSIHVINKETDTNFIGLFLKDNNEKREYLHVRFIIAATDSTFVTTHYRLICTEKKRRNN